MRLANSPMNSPHLGARFLIFYVDGGSVAFHVLIFMLMGAPSLFTFLILCTWLATWGLRIPPRWGPRFKFFSDGGYMYGSADSRCTPPSLPPSPPRRSNSEKSITERAQSQTSVANAAAAAPNPYFDVETVQCVGEFGWL